MEQQAKHYDALVIGGGLSGLTAASLLAKRGLSVCVAEQSDQPGGSCGIFRRGDVTFDQGSAMLYGFGEHGFNAHRFVLNCLEQPFDVIKHELLYVVNYQGRRIRFFSDVDQFAEELTRVFPTQRKQIQRFYRDMQTLYQHVMVDTPSYSTADETDPKSGLESIKKHPYSYLKFLSYLNRSAKSLLRQYFTDPEIFNFFDKLTSTYCYATVEEAPAVLAAVMFVDSHVGGSYYPAGSTLFLPGVLEKAIEEHGGDMRYNSEVVSILFEGGKPCGVLLNNGTKLFASEFIYSGTVWNLSGKLLDPSVTTKKRRDWQWSRNEYPCFVLYARGGFRHPAGYRAREMLVGNPEQIDVKRGHAYILSSTTARSAGRQAYRPPIWPYVPNMGRFRLRDYQCKKVWELKRLLGVLERRFPGFTEAVRYAEVSTPHTIERYTLKNGGAVAGPKQMLGQHMFRRQHTRTDWDNLFCCGESTVMGTGTPTVTTSGISAANAVLKKRGLEPFVYQKDQKNFMRIVERPFTRERLYESAPEPQKSVMQQAMRCRFCEHPTCCAGSGTDIPGIMRRVAVGNFAGAKKRYLEHPANERALKQFEQDCILSAEGGNSVAIRNIILWLTEETS